MFDPVVYEADMLRRRIYNTLENTTQQAFTLEQSWTRLGIMLSMFKAKECWRQYPDLYKNFGDFMEELKVRFKRGRTQLWGYLSVAENLLPSVGAEKLEQMGISKALELKRALKKLEGKPLPQALLDSALDPAKTTKELRGDIGKALNLTPEPDGTWFDWGGSFLTKEEKDFMKEAILVTIGLLGIKADVPESVQRKAVFKAWAEEFYATHSPEFYGVADGGGSAPAVLLTRGQDSGSGAKG